VEAPSDSFFGTRLSDIVTGQAETHALLAEQVKLLGDTLDSLVVVHTNQESIDKQLDRVRDNQVAVEIDVERCDKNLNSIETLLEENLAALNAELARINGELAFLDAKIQARCPP